MTQNEENALLYDQENWTSLANFYGETFLDNFHRNMSNLMCFCLLQTFIMMLGNYYHVPFSEKKKKRKKKVFSSTNQSKTL